MGHLASRSARPNTSQREKKTPLSKGRMDGMEGTHKGSGLWFAGGRKVFTERSETSDCE